MFTTYLHLKLSCVGIDSICCDKQVISYRLLTVILLKKIKVFKKKITITLIILILNNYSLNPYSEKRGSGFCQISK